MWIYTEDVENTIVQGTHCALLLRDREIVSVNKEFNRLFS